MENRQSRADLVRSNLSYALDKLRGWPIAGLIIYPALAIHPRGAFPYLLGLVAITHAVNFGATFWDRGRQIDDRVIYDRAALSYALAPWLLFLIPGATTRVGLTLIFPTVCVSLIAAYFVAMARFDLRSVTFRRRFLLGAAGVWIAFGLAALVVLGLIGSRALDVPDVAKTASVFVGPLIMVIAFMSAQKLLAFSRTATDHRLARPGIAADDRRAGWIVALEEKSPTS